MSFGGFGLTLLWGTLVGAAPSAVQGTLSVSPDVVSPDQANVSTADRKITIALTDADLDTVAFVGNGPNQESPDFGTADGEQLTVTDGTLQGAGFIAVLKPM